ncbi:MAG: hypothetical protein U0892_00890 [Pirellulales bacterium]
MRGRSRRTVSAYVSAAALELGVLVVFVLVAKPQLTAALMSIVDSLAASALPAARAVDPNPNLMFHQNALPNNGQGWNNAGQPVPQTITQPVSVTSPNAYNSQNVPTQLAADDWRVATPQSSGRDVSQWGIVAPRPTPATSVEPIGYEYRTAYAPYASSVGTTVSGTTSNYVRPTYRPYDNAPRQVQRSSSSMVPAPDYRAPNYFGSDWK